MLDWLAGPAAALLTWTFAIVEASLFGWAVGTYYHLDAIRWYVTRLLPAALLAHLLALALLLLSGHAPQKDIYLLGLLLGLVVGLPVVWIATGPLQRRFDRRFAAKPPELRALERPPADLVHPVLDPRGPARSGRRADVEDPDVLARARDEPEDPIRSR